MIHSIEVVQLEALINRLRDGQPSDAVALSAPLQVLAELYGRMIYAGQARVELAALGEAQRRLLQTLVADGAPAAPS